MDTVCFDKYGPSFLALYGIRESVAKRGHNRRPSKYSYSDSTLRTMKKK